jgi:soluble lytic murein transglycosylase
MTRRRSVFLAVLGFLFAAPLPSPADILRLSSGKTLEGVIIEQREGQVSFQLPEGTLVLSPAHIQSIQNESPAEDQVRLGKALLKLNRTDEAMACFQKAVDIDPNQPEAAALLEQTRTGRTLQDLEPRLAPLRNQILQNHFSNALEGYRALSEEFQGSPVQAAIDRERAEAHADYAFFLYDHLYPDRALDEIRKAQALGGDFAQLHFVLGRLSDLSSHYEDAIWEYQETLRLNPNHGKAQSALNRLKALFPRLFEEVKPTPTPSVAYPGPSIIPTPRPAPAPLPAPADIAEAIDYFARQKNFDPNFIETIIRLESNFNPNAVSEADCRGLMQLGKAAWNDTVRRLKKNWDFETSVYDPLKNIEVATEYLRWMRDEYFSKYTAELAGIPIEVLLLQGYHSGPWRTVVYRGKVPGPRLKRYLELYTQYRQAP